MVSIIIVNYNTRDALHRCLSSLTDQTDVIVVDNASADGSVQIAESFPNVRVVRNHINVGFGAANNQGIQLAKSDLVLLLNSDAYAKPGSIQKLEAVFADDEVIAAGGRLFNLDGSTQSSCGSELTLWAVFCEQTLLEKLFPNSTLFSPYWRTKRLLRKGNGPFQVDQVMGACIMMRPKVLFDERFFLYCEDTELCRRLQALGKILYVPAAEFLHELGSSSSQNRWRSIAMYHVGKELYFRIHHGPSSARACYLLNRMGAVLRLCIWAIGTVLSLGFAKKTRMQVRTFWKVLTAPANYRDLQFKA